MGGKARNVSLQGLKEMLKFHRERILYSEEMVKWYKGEIKKEKK